MSSSNSPQDITGEVGIKEGIVMSSSNSPQDITGEAGIKEGIIMSGSHSPQDITGEVGIQGVVAAIGVAGGVIKFVLPLPTGHVDVQRCLVT